MSWVLLQIVYFSTKFSLVFSNWLIFPSFFLISFSRSSNYADINSSDSVTLIWDSFASSWKVKSFFTSFSILFIQFTSNFANSGEFKPSEKTLSGRELKLSLFFYFLWILSISRLVREISFFASQEKSYYNQLYEQR